MHIQMTEYHGDNARGSYDDSFTPDAAAKVMSYHRTLAEYEPTPLCALSSLAETLGTGGIYVKDESKRFGLNAFKGLGGSYALASVISKRLGLSLDDVKNVAPGTFTFVTATDGNHGRGVAWAARSLGQRAVVYMPKGSALERLNNIRALGADAEITDMNYDDTVRFARDRAEENGWILVQDTAFEGYEDIPLAIMQGYMTMAAEALEQLGDTVPTHVFLQAGVGSMAGAVTGFICNYYGDKRPKIIIVEPDRADCNYKTAAADDGELHKVTGDMDSMMAGLCCGEVCTVAWEILRHRANYFFSCPDYVSADGMRVLGNPVGNDARVVSGESGAVTAGLLYNLLTDDALGDMKNKLGLDSQSAVLCFSTEGDTDRENYRRVVWDGFCAKQSRE